MSDPRCKQCGYPLIEEIELDYETCQHCLETMAERTRQRSEWDHCHPGEPCPEIELTPLPRFFRARIRG